MADQNGMATTPIGDQISEQNGTQSATQNGAANSAAKSGGRPKVQMSRVPFPPIAMPMSYEEIAKILPHRFPLLLVDRIVELEPGNRCVGYKNVTFNEEYFQGHFPGHPVMPGVLMLESMAQVAGILILVSRNTPGALSYFAAMENVRFRQPVQPGDQLVTEATLQVLRGPLCKVRVVGRVGNEVVVEADYTFFTSVAEDDETAIARATGTGDANGKTDDRVEIVTPPRQGEGKTFVHPTALVDRTAELEDGVWIGPHCIVEGGTRIGAGTVLESKVVIKRGTSVGARCRLWPGVILGHEPQDMKFHGEESFVRIGDDNMLRELVTIHRATGDGNETRIGNSNLLMAYVHIGHNCTVGSNNMISNSTGISGHVTIEDKVVVGGFSGIHQFVHIGKMGMVGGLSKVTQDVPPFCICDGRPSRVHGLNVRGLRRNGVPSEVRNQVSAAFKLMYRSGLNTSQALERVHAEIPRSETLDYFIDFVERVREGRLGRQDETPHL